MPNLVIRFIDGSGPISRAITWTTNSLWCHTEALSRDGKAWIGAHAGTGVQARPLDWTKPIRERRYAIPVKQSAWIAAHNFLDSQVGNSYGYGICFGLAMHKRILDPGRVICSELMVEFMQAAGLLPLNVLPDFDALITPETLHLSPLFIGRGIPNT